MALADRRVRGDGDDDVGEALRARTPQAQPPQLHRRLEPGDCTTRYAFVVFGRAVHERIDVAARKAECGHDHESRDEQRRDRVAGREPERGRYEPGQHRQRPGEVAGEMKRVRQQRVAAVEPSPAERNHRAGPVDREDQGDRRERPPGRVDVDLDDVREAEDRHDRDEDADRGEKPGLGKRGEVLRLPMAVGMTAIRRTYRNRDGEERQQRGGEVRSRVRCLGEEAEARAREPRGQLDRDEETGGRRPRRARYAAEATWAKA